MAKPREPANVRTPCSPRSGRTRSREAANLRTCEPLTPLVQRDIPSSAHAIEFFEPRLAQVKVVFGDQANSADRALRFRIDALLKVEPAPEPVVFDTKVKVAA